jgi:hypothetical protein
MTNENNGALAHEIPVPPGGGSWSWNAAERKWVSNDPAPDAEPAEIADEAPTHTIEQEQ